MGRGLDGYLISVHWHCVVLKAREEAASRPVSGGYGEGETPLPIPNRAVKPLSADGTRPARAWESRSPPVFPSSRPSIHDGRLVALQDLCPSASAHARPQPDARAGASSGHLLEVRAF